MTNVKGAMNQKPMLMVELDRLCLLRKGLYKGRVRIDFCESNEGEFLEEAQECRLAMLKKVKIKIELIKKILLNL